MAKKRILIIINSLSKGGAERVVSILLERFNHDSSYDVGLILLEDVIEYDLPEDITITKLSRLNNNHTSLKKTLAIPLLSYRLHKHIKNINPDLIVSFLFRSDFVNILSSFLDKKPRIVSQRVNASSTYNNSSLNAKINKFLIKMLYPKANLVINVSAGTKEDLYKNFGVDDKKQIVIHNPYDSKKIERLSKDEITYNLEKEKTIVVVSRFRVIKNIKMILEAFSKLDSDATLLLVGDGVEEEMLKRRVKELAIEGRVVFVGGVDNPYKYCAKSSIYISASLSEGFPNAMVEAMICGCAVISTDCPSGPREILAPQSDFTKALEKGSEEAEFGILVAMHDVDALYQSLDNLLNDSKKCLHYSVQAKVRAQSFLFEEIYLKYCDAFDSMIEEAS